MEREYTESEIRRAFMKGQENNWCWAEVLAELTGPRLKPDCHVEDADGIAWSMSASASRSQAKRPYTPLIRADRVMKWAQAYRDEYTTAAPVRSFFAVRIREETEVSDG